MPCCYSLAFIQVQEKGEEKKMLIVYFSFEHVQIPHREMSGKQQRGRVGGEFHLCHISNSIGTGKGMLKKGNNKNQNPSLHCLLKFFGLQSPACVCFEDVVLL